MQALALDLGGSGGKLLWGSFDGQKIKVKDIHRFHNEPVDARGHLTWDMRGIHAHLLEGLRKAASEKIASFGVDAFCNDYGLLDASGNLISQVYMYRDRRTEGVLEWMDRVMPPEELFRRTGCQRARFNTLVQLAAQAKGAEQTLLEQATTLLFVPDLLNFYLCGEVAAEYTIASVSQVYSRIEAGWDREIMRSFGVPERIFPKVIAPATRLGKASQELLDQTGMGLFSVCTVGHHDTASAVAAVPSLERHFAYISSGTWSLMGTETGQMITSEAAFRANFANEGGLGGRNRFSKNIMGLWLLQECQRQLAAMGMRRTFEEMDREAESAARFRSIINPDEALFFEPGDMIGKVQSRCREGGQAVPESVGEITRCIKESLALAYRITLETLEKVSGVNYACVHIIGGGARSNLLNQMAASAMRRPVLAGPYDATAIGNLCAQFMAAGELADLEEARRVVRASFEICEFVPEDEAGWEEAYERYLAVTRG